MRNITPLVAPRSIAVIGASANPTKSGGVLFDNLLKGNFQGPLYPINRTAKEIMGKTAYPTLADVPEKVDLVYIVLPQQHVEDAVNQCVAAGARATCIITAGFSEAGPKGRGDEERLREIADTSGLLLAGPNTIGMVNAEVGMMGSFVNFPRWKDGGVSFFTQTGIFTGAVMLHVMSGATQRLPVGKSIDVGNKVDVDELDFLHFAADDPATKVIGFYIESIRNPRAFLEKAREVRKSKPIVVLKPGRTKDGARASASHTGSLASDDDILDGALRQYGIARAEDEDDFLNALRALVMLPKPRGKSVGIGTTSGALGVISTDLLVESGLQLATFAPGTIAAMPTILPDWLEPANPFDFWIASDIKGPREAHEAGLTALFADPNVDLVLCTLLAPGNADFPEFGELLRRLRRTYDKPVVLVIYGGAAQQRSTEGLAGAHGHLLTTTRAGARPSPSRLGATTQPAPRPRGPTGRRTVPAASVPAFSESRRPRFPSPPLTPVSSRGKVAYISFIASICAKKAASFMTAVSARSARDACPPPDRVSTSSQRSPFSATAKCMNPGPSPLMRKSPVISGRCCSRKTAPRSPNMTSSETAVMVKRPLHALLCRLRMVVARHIAASAPFMLPIPSP